MKRYLICLLVLGLGAGCDLLSKDKVDAGTTTGGCTKTSECASGRVCVAEVCNVPGVAVVGAPCWASRDCTSGNFCNPLNQRCLPGGDGRIGDPCLFDLECTAGLRCNYTGFGGYCQNTGMGDVADTCTQQSDCTAGLYCGRGNECNLYSKAFPKSDGVMCPTDTMPFHSYFEVPSPTTPIADFYRLPFPNDIRVHDGKLDLSDFARPGPTPLGPDLVKLYTDALVADFDGFSPMIPIAFRFSKEIDFSYFRDHALGNLRFVDLTTKIELGGFGMGSAPSRNKFACENFITVYPQIYDAPLTAGHKYAVVIGTSAVRTLDGMSATQDADLAAVLAPNRPADEVNGKAWDAYTDLRTWLGTEQISPASVVNAAVFTLADPKIHMQRLATAVAAQPAPVLSNLFQCGGAGADPCDDGTEARRCGGDDPDLVEVHGKISMPIFQTGTEPYEKEGGGLNELNGQVVKVKNLEVCFAMTLPKGTMPPAGWPLVVYGHGTGGSFRSFISDGIASAMAKATPKTAVFSFDSVGHGLRRGTSTKKPEELVFNVLNPRAARDNFAQGAADLLTAFQLPRSAAPAGWTGPTLKFAPKVVFFGHSQGSTHGSLALPYTDDAPAAVLSGAGAGLSASLQEKTSPFNIPQGIAFLLGNDSFDSNHPMLTIWQSYFDRADPANFDRHIILSPVAGHTSKHIYMSWGTGDTYSPRSTLRGNAIFLGVNPVNNFVAPDDLYELPAPINRPVKQNLTVTGGTVTGAVFQYAPPSGVDGHFVATRNANAVKDWTAFVSSYFTTGVPAIP